MIVTTKWHHNPSPPKAVISLTFCPKAVISISFREVGIVLYGGWHLHGCALTKSLLASSSMAVPWWLPSLESPGREAAMQGFPESCPPYQGDYGVTGGNSSGFHIQSPHGSSHR